MGYDDWKARAPAEAEERGCERCDNAPGECECDVVAPEDVPIEAITDEDVRDLAHEVRQHRATIAEVERVLAGLERDAHDRRDPSHESMHDRVWMESRNEVIALLRAALGKPT